MRAYAEVVLRSAREFRSMDSRDARNRYLQVGEEELSLPAALGVWLAALTTVGMEPAAHTFGRRRIMDGVVRARRTSTEPEFVRFLGVAGALARRDVACLLRLGNKGEAPYRAADRAIVLSDVWGVAVDVVHHGTSRVPDLMDSEERDRVLGCRKWFRWALTEGGCEGLPDLEDSAWTKHSDRIPEAAREWGRPPILLPSR